MTDNGNNWIGSWFSAARNKSSEVLEFVKKDLGEFGSAVKSEASSMVTSTGAVLEKTLKLDEPESTASTMKRSISSFLGQMNEVLNPSPDDSDTEAIMIVEDSETVTLTKLQQAIYNLQKDEKTFLNDPELALKKQYECWLEIIDDQLSEDRISKHLASSSTLKTQYSNLVPNLVSHTLFWKRYLFKKALLEDDIARKEAMERRELKEKQVTEDSLKWDQEDFANDIELTEEEQIRLLEQYENETRQKLPEKQHPKRDQQKSQNGEKQTTEKQRVDKQKADKQKADKQKAEQRKNQTSAEDVLLQQTSKNTGAKKKSSMTLIETSTGNKRSAEIKRSAGNKIADRKIIDKKITDKKITDTKITDKNITDKKITDKKITDTKITDTKITDKKITDTKITDTKITGKNISVKNISDNKNADKKPTDKDTEEKSSAQKVKHEAISDSMEFIEAEREDLSPKNSNDKKRGDLPSTETESIISVGTSCSNSSTDDDWEKINENEK